MRGFGWPRRRENFRDIIHFQLHWTLSLSLSLSLLLYYTLFYTYHTPNIISITRAKPSINPTHPNTLPPPRATKQPTYNHHQHRHRPPQSSKPTKPTGNNGPNPTNPPSTNNNPHKPSNPIQIRLNLSKRLPHPRNPRPIPPARRDHLRARPVRPDDERGAESRAA